MNEAPATVVLLKFDVVDSTLLAAEAMPLVRDAVEYAATGYGVDAGFPRWEGDGGSAYFRGEDAAQRAVRAALDAVERVRLIPGHRVNLRTSVGIGDATDDADMTKLSLPDFNRAGHMAARDVCPPGGVCVTEDVYFLLGTVAPPLAQRFAYLGRTAREGAAVFAFPPGHQPTKPGGLRPAATDSYPASLRLRSSYSRPPFSCLRFYALPQFNFVGTLDLLSVFTPLSVHPSGTEPSLDEEFVPEEAAREGALADTDRTKQQRMILRSPRSALAQPFSTVFARTRALVVLGDPGSGKTTLLRYLAIAAAGGSHSMRARLGVAECLLPVHVVAAAALKALREHSEDSPACICARLLAPRIEERAERLAAAITETANAGEALFLVDGVDEMPEAADRLAVAQWIEQLGGAYPMCRVVVASRLIGYPGIALSGAEELVLEPLTRDQTRTLGRAFFTEFYRAQRYTADAAAAQGTTQGDRLALALEERPTLGPFAGNPLLLSLAALVHVQLGALPRYRVKLYDVATETLVSAWAKARQPVGEPEQVRAVDYVSEGRRVLPALALHMHDHCPAGVISQADLLEQIASRLSATGSASDLKDVARARDFLTRLEHAGSLLVERGAGQWGFLHQTFQEYLAAKCLAEEDRQDELVGVRLYQPRWQEVIRFVAGELGIVQGRGPAAARFICAILQDRTDWRATELRWNTLLAATCLADTVCTDRKLEKDLVEDLLRRTDDPRFPRWQIRWSLSEIKGTPLGDALAARLAQRSEGDARVEALAALGRADLGVSILLPQLGDIEHAEARRRAAEALGRLGAREAITTLRQVLRVDTDGSVRVLAAEALGALGAREAIPDLLEALRADKEGDARAEAAVALGKLGAEDAIPDLLQSLRADENRWVRSRAAFALGILGARETVPDLFKTLREDKDANARCGAAQALGIIGVNEAIPDLLFMLERKDGFEDELARYDLGQFDHYGAATALGDLGVREAIPALLKTLRGDTDDFARYGAAVALGQLGAREAIPDLLKVLRAAVDHWRREDAVAAPGEPADVTAIRKNIESLGYNPHPWARKGAANSLGRLGARAAIHLLRGTMLRDPDTSVAAAAAEALWRIVETLEDPVVEEGGRAPAEELGF